MKGNEQLKEYGKRLRLYHLCNHMDELLHVAQQDKPTYHEFLMGLLEREITCREKKDYERRLSAARLPQRHDLDLYDFNFAEGITQYYASCTGWSRPTMSYLWDLPVQGRPSLRQDWSMRP